MTDTTVAESATSKRKQVSKRDLLNAQGEVTKAWGEATGARYTLVGLESSPFDIQFGEAGKAATMFAIFGAHTKLGNVANTVLNDKSEPGSVDDAALEIQAFIEEVSKGTWTEKTGGGGASKVDKNALAEAIVEVFAKHGQTREHTAVLEALTDKPHLIAQFRKNPEILDAYNKRTGGTAPKVDNLFDKI